jgi:hypothetical protein
MDDVSDGHDDTVSYRATLHPSPRVLEKRGTRNTAIVGPRAEGVGITFSLAGLF